jgi:predicted ribosomally synthesized peptide with SipW-like signal peptide
MKLNRNRKRVAALLVVALLALATVGAYAYFTSTGSGSGSVTVGTSSAWQVDTLAATGGPLTPGGGASTYEAVGYNVTNNSTGAQGLTNVNIKVAQANGSAWTAQSNGAKPACTASDFQLSLDNGTSFAAPGASVDDTALAGTVAAGATTSNGTVTMRDTGANQDNCKGVTVPLYLSAS